MKNNHRKSLGITLGVTEFIISAIKLFYYGFAFTKLNNISDASLTDDDISSQLLPIVLFCCCMQLPMLVSGIILIIKQPRSLGVMTIVYSGVSMIILSLFLLTKDDYLSLLTDRLVMPAMLYIFYILFFILAALFLSACEKRKKH